MIQEAIEKIQELVPPTIVDGAPGFKLSDREMKTLDTRPHVVKEFAVSTLRAFVGLVAAKINDLKADNVAVFVDAFDKVSVVERKPDEFGRRQVHLFASIPSELKTFEFGVFHPHDQFLIKLAAQFTNTEDRDYLLGIAANITNEHVIESDDNGIAQKIGLRSGAALKTQAIVKNRVFLAPYRTFREVDQPVSEFLFRVKQDKDEVPKLALIEADGGAWRIKAVGNIRDWIENALKSQGDGTIPVIA